MADENATKLTTEKVAYWYFRLNGYLQMENFIVHPAQGKSGQRTDADLIGVRFPHRKERLLDEPGNVMQDDLAALKLTDDWTDIAIVEVKTNGECILNGPWTDEDAQNVHRVLAAIGYFDPGRLEEIATMMYETGLFADERLKVRVRLVAIAATESADLKQSHPEVTQLTWPAVVGFIGYRLYTYRSAKRDSPQWEETIMLMKGLVSTHSEGQKFNPDDFIGDCLQRLGVK